MKPDAETEVLLKILELGECQVAEERVRDAAEAIAELRRNLKERGRHIDTGRARSWVQ